MFFKRALFGALVICLSAMIAAAETPTRAEQARQKFERGVVLMGQTKWQEAVVELEAARALYPTAPVHFNLGLAYRALGRGRDAIASLERYRRAVGEGMDAARQAEVNRYLATLRAGLAQLQLEVIPTDATILVDKEPMRPGVLELDPGKHVIDISATGFEPGRRELELTPGSTTRVQIALVKMKVPARLIVTVEQPIAAIKIDGQLRGEGRVSADLPAGRHSIEVSAAGFETVMREVKLVEGVDESLSLTLKRKRKKGPYIALGIILVAVAGGAVAAGVILGSKDQAPLSPQLGVVHTGIEVAKW